MQEVYLLTALCNTGGVLQATYRRCLNLNMRRYARSLFIKCCMLYRWRPQGYIQEMPESKHEKIRKKFIY